MTRLLAIITLQFAAPTWVAVPATRSWIEKCLSTMLKKNYYQMRLENSEQNTTMFEQRCYAKPSH